ncbi:hypothetical protein [Streptomyces abikoensis]|uniref:hypothetical protein n=1 Tax=Streptomyces abikoensis TaxID=97398 RepID=UPI00167A87E1|nr:hypothetical protein [Streptomyces abikoensis]GGP35164.1 hypothetical protein GCM10010214_04680 [Streptomyces abikoensis]
MGNSSRWRYVVMEGEAKARGVAHGEALADRIVESLERADFMSRQDTGLPFEFFVSKVHEAFGLKGLHEEVQHELEGIVEGCHNRGKTEVTFDRLVALNGAEELIDSWWPWYQEKHHGRGARKRREARPRCSAFMAIGSATTDGRIVAAHNSWDRFASGDAYNVVLDIRPPAGKGHRVLMQAAPGWVSSNTDWMLTDAGLIVVETTIGSFDGAYIPHGKPEFARSRVATQFADSITHWTSLFAENNNAGYVNTWLLGGPSGRQRPDAALRHPGQRSAAHHPRPAHQRGEGGPGPRQNHHRRPLRRLHP